MHETVEGNYDGANIRHAVYCRGTKKGCIHSCCRDIWNVIAFVCVRAKFLRGEREGEFRKGNQRRCNPKNTGVHDINKHWEDFKGTVLAGTPLSLRGGKGRQCGGEQTPSLRYRGAGPLSLSYLIWERLDYLFTGNVLVTGSWPLLLLKWGMWPWRWGISTNFNNKHNETCLVLTPGNICQILGRDPNSEKVCWCDTCLHTCITVKKGGKKSWMLSTNKRHKHNTYTHEPSLRFDMLIIFVIMLEA